MTQRDRDYDDFYDDLNDNEYLDEYDELFFDDDEPPEVGEQLPDFEIERHQSPERTQHAGLTGASLHADTSTLDDASPETLLPMTAPAAPMKPEEKAPPPISDYQKPGSIISVRDLGWMRRSWPALSHWTNDLGMTIPGRDLRPSLSRSVRDRAGTDNTRRLRKQTGFDWAGKPMHSRKKHLSL